MEATAAATADEMRTRWGRRLRALRNRNKRSQVEIAAVMQTEQATVSRAERGKSDLDTYVRLAEANGTTLEAITAGPFADSLDAEAEDA